MPDVQCHVWIEFLDPLQQPNGVEITRAGAHGQIIRWHRFQIVIENVRTSVHDSFQRTVLAQEVRRKDFDCRVG